MFVIGFIIGIAVGVYYSDEIKSLISSIKD